MLTGWLCCSSSAGKVVLISELGWEERAGIAWTVGPDGTPPTVQSKQQPLKHLGPKLLVLCRPPGASPLSPAACFNPPFNQPKCFCCLQTTFQANRTIPWLRFCPVCQKSPRSIKLTCYSGAQGKTRLTVVGMDGYLSHGRDRDTRKGHSCGGQWRLGASS